MSNVVFDDVLALALQLPFDEQRRLEERLSQEREMRIREYQKTAKQIGGAFDQHDLTEEALDAEVDAIRQELYEERHGRHHDHPVTSPTIARMMRSRPPWRQ